MSTAPTLLVFDGIVHPWLPAQRRLKQCLQQIPRIRFQSARSLEILTNAERQGFGSLVLYFQQQKISPTALDQLERFVQCGGGLLAIHCASASFKGERRYQQLLGGAFAGHAPIQRFLVERANTTIFAGIADFQVRDERYRHELLAPVEVHFSTLIDGQPEPVVWTRRHGGGRICYCALGHTLAALNHPALQDILRQGLSWVSAGSGAEDRDGR